MGLFAGKTEKPASATEQLQKEMNGELDADLYLKQKLLTILNEKYSIYDANENPVYDVKGSITGLEFKVTNSVSGEEVFTIKKKLIAVMPSYTVVKNGQTIGEVKKKMALTKVVFEGQFDGQPMDLVGNFNAWDFNINIGGKEVGGIHKKLLSWSDCYAISTKDEAAKDYVLAIAVIIDNALHSGK